MKRSRVGTAVALVVLLTVGGLTALPILMLGISASPSSCGGVSDGTPSILGPSTLTVSELRTWWASTDRGQPPRLHVAIDDLIATYVSQGTIEGVRGDLAFAQAVLETGYFTNSDSEINNYAGIAHYDGSGAGTAFPDPATGVRAHIQLLKKFALGNDTPLANPDVAPRAGAAATTWGQLAGTWASSPSYWSSLSGIYDAMLTHAGRTPDQIDPFAALASASCPDGGVLVDGDYALPVGRRWYDEHPEWFTLPHHDTPAIDIPVPVGTPIYAVTDGVVVTTTTTGDCGIGVVLNGDDRAQYTYCHGQPGTHAVAVGDHVTVGQYLMNSASTGNSTGPHLHFAIEFDGTTRCPQAFLISIAEGELSVPSGLLTSGCTN